MTEPTFNNWQDQWDYEAQKARTFFESKPLEELLTLVKENKTDFFFNIWDVIAGKSTPEDDSLEVLWTYLKDHPGDNYDLDRYHCTGAIFKILYNHKRHEEHPLRNAVQWDHNGEEARQKALLELKALFPKAS